MALVKSIAELEAIFWAELMDILGHDTSVTPPPVRRSWPTDGAPDWRITDNVVFMQLSEAGDAYMQDVDSVLEEAGRDLVLRRASTRTLQLKLIAYGPACYESLLDVRMALVGGRPKLRKQKIYPVGGADSVQYVPELFQGRWWKRADLSMTFNCLMVFSTSVNAIEQVDVTIKANEPGSQMLEPGDIIIKKG